MSDSPTADQYTTSLGQVTSPPHGGGALPLTGYDVVVVAVVSLLVLVAGIILRRNVAKNSAI